MVESRADLRRLGHEQNNQYKRTLAFVIFLITTLVLITTTFLNPLFMKNQIRTSNNRAVVVRQVNTNFNDLAVLVGANQDEDSNLLTSAQTQPIADHIIDYSLGIHWFKVSNADLANQILRDIEANVDQGSSSNAQRVNSQLKKQGANAQTAVVKAFNLNIITLGANLAGLLLIVNVIIIVVTIITLFSLLSDMHSRASLRMVIHDGTGAGMWAGFWLILLFGLLALIPIIFDVDGTDFGFLLEIGSSIFLDYVIAGVIIYIVCAIPWQITAAK